MRKVTPENITSLKSNQIFVFGSNLEGIHGGGAARFAAIHFGAVFGVGVGRTGQCYAIPTMHGGPDAIAPYVNDFVKYAAAHPELEFLVTRIGCGIAGFYDSEIAPLFREAYKYSNIVLPKEFVAVIESMMTRLVSLKRVYVDMDNVLVDFDSGLARVDEAVKSRKLTKESLHLSAVDVVVEKLCNSLGMQATQNLITPQRGKTIAIHL